MKAIAEHYYKVIRTSDKFNTKSPCNDIDLLYPEFKEKIDTLISAYLEEHQTEPYILETYRSNTMQLIYFNRGASKIRTNGMHHYGIAVDIVGKDKHGNIDWDVLDYEWLRHYAVKELGLTVLSWELAHFQFIPVSKQQELRNVVSNYGD